MKYLFIGLGSIGMRHLQNLRMLTDEPIIAYRSKIDDKIDKKYNIKSYLNFEKALQEKPDVAFITNPTNMHLNYALYCAKVGCHLFIEKPISINKFYLDKLFDMMNKRNKVCFVGYNFRFHPDIIKIKELLNNNTIGQILYAKFVTSQYLPDWHPEEDYRKSYAARKELGGGALLTMSHTIDYAYWLLNTIKPLYKKISKISDLDINVEDNVDILCTAKNDAVVILHMDFIQKTPTRQIEIFGKDGWISWNYYNDTLKVFSYKNGLQKYKHDLFNRNEMYMDELKHFLNCVKDGVQPKITQTDIIDVMKLIESVQE